MPPVAKRKASEKGAARRMGRVRSGALGERTVQTLKLPPKAYNGVVLWSKQRSTPLKAVFISDIYDEALIWFLEREAAKPYDAYIAASSKSGERRALWIDSRLLERAADVADRDGVARNRVLYTAIVKYLSQFGPPPS